MIVLDRVVRVPDTDQPPLGLRLIPQQAFLSVLSNACRYFVRPSFPSQRMVHVVFKWHLAVLICAQNALCSHRWTARRQALKHIHTHPGSRTTNKSVNNVRSRLVLCYLFIIDILSFLLQLRRLCSSCKNLVSFSEFSVKIKSKKKTYQIQVSNWKHKKPTNAVGFSTFVMNIHKHKISWILCQLCLDFVEFNVHL